MSPIRLCLEPTCPNPATVRGRCRDHATEARRINRSVNDSFYASKAWRLARRRQLFEHPLCEQCGAIADTVHHRTPIEQGGARRDPSNLESLCSSCHSSLHANHRRSGRLCLRAT